jgi:hypothetical protein
MNILKQYSKGDLQEIYAFNKAIKALPATSLQWFETKNNYAWSKEMHFNEVDVILDLKNKAIGFNHHSTKADKYVPGSDKHTKALAEHAECKRAYELVEKYKIQYTQVIDEPYYKNPDGQMHSFRTGLDIFKYTFTIKIEKYRDVEDTDTYDSYGEYLGCDQESYMDDQDFYFYTTTPYSPKESDIIKGSLDEFLLRYDLNYTHKHHYDDAVEIDDNPIGNYLNNIKTPMAELSKRRRCTNNSLNFDELVKVFGGYDYQLKCYPWSFVDEDYRKGHILCNDVKYSLDSAYGDNKVVDIVNEFLEWYALEDKQYVIDDKIVKIKTRLYWKDFACKSYVTFKALNLQEYEPVKEQS